MHLAKNVFLKDELRVYVQLYLLEAPYSVKIEVQYVHLVTSTQILGKNCENLNTCKYVIFPHSLFKKDYR
jgi:hypothetical protein